MQQCRGLQYGGQDQVLVPLCQVCLWLNMHTFSEPSMQASRLKAKGTFLPFIPLGMR